MKRTLGEQLAYELARSRRLKNPSRYFYYRQFLGQENIVAFASWEQFRGSWAYSRFNADNRSAIEQMIREDNQRFPRTWQEA